MILQEAYSKATSQKQFYELLKKQNLTLYRHGKHIGIKAKRKYRLQTLGYSKQRIALLELEKTQRQKQLSRIIELKQKQQELDLEQEL